MEKVSIDEKATNLNFAFLAGLILLVALNVADLVITVYGVRHGAVEGNPLIKTMLGSSITGLTILKVGGILICSYMLWIIRKAKVTWFALATFNLVYIGVLINNCHILWG